MPAPPTKGNPHHGELGWRVADFVRRVPGVAHAVVVSADGLRLASSDRLPAARADELCAVASGVISLVQSAARCVEAGTVGQTVVEMDHGSMILMSVSDGSCLTLLAAPQCEMGMVAYEMTLLVEQVGTHFTPEHRAEHGTEQRTEEDVAGAHRP